MERKLMKINDLRTEYIKFMDEYMALGHMSPINDDSMYEGGYVMPHHAVVKDSSSTTKVRVVFNASSKSDSGFSLNDCLMTGPTIQQDLFSIMTRFRKYPIGLTADIAKMYRQILIHESDRKYQQVYWRTNEHETMELYRLNTVTYGTASAPFLAIRTLFQLAHDEKERFPIASEIVERDFYVGDLVTGASSEEEAIQLKTELTSLLKSGGFDLRKWVSNSCNIGMIQDDKSTVSVLGILWERTNDRLQISIGSIEPTTEVTKRSVLSQIAKLFDPLGVCAPIVFTAKVFLQKLWSMNDLSWDEPLPVHLVGEWNEFVAEIPVINNLSIPRCFTPYMKYKTIDLHGFGDASELGYGCVIYVKTINERDEIHCQLICSKSKVAPLKKLSIPRLELCAALLLAQLVKKVLECIDIKFDSVTLYSDSEITLYRIKSHPNRFCTFVANRISLIQDIAPIDSWAYVPSKDNPADVVSRGTKSSDLQSNEMWWNGPNFLRKSSPSLGVPNLDNIQFKPEELELKKRQLITGTTLINTQGARTLIESYSSLTRLLRVAALCRRFWKNVKASPQERMIEQINAKELEEALYGLIKFVQSQSFSNEIAQLSKNEKLSRKSPLLKLNPFLDKDGLLRVGGRLTNSELDYDQKYPILLTNKSHLTRLIIEKAHHRHLHAGPQSLLNYVRQQFWIIGGKYICRGVVHKCIRCFRTKPVIINQVMGQLPKERVCQSNPFDIVGIDYCGPVTVNYKVRSKVTGKAYVVVFICFVTKAIHLEVASDLTTQAFLDALRRFVARRGPVKQIISDNATNFVGGNNELKRLQHLFNIEVNKQEILRFCSSEGIMWTTIPPRSPHFGGLWEAAVKSAKFHMKRVLGNNICTVEELNTLVIQIEACLNSRPLTPMSEDPSDLMPLSPAHFLTGGKTVNLLSEPTLLSLNFNRLSRYQRLIHNLQKFWLRWSRDYLVELQHRQKWLVTKREVQVGDMVLLKEENVPPLKWIIGRVLQTHPGSDNHVRVITIKTPSGIFKRAVGKIAVLPIET